MSAIAPRLPATSLGDMMRERGYVACRCGAQLKRTVRAWECSRKECDDLGRGVGGKTRTADAKHVGGMAGRLPTPASPRPFRHRAGRAAEDALAAALTGAGYVVQTYGEWLRTATMTGAWSGDVVREFPWGLTLAPTRRFRSDFAIPRRGLLLEVDGRVHHVVARQGRTDVLRAQLAEQAGYRILRVLPEQVNNGEALALVRRAVGGAK